MARWPRLGTRNCAIPLIRDILPKQAFEALLTQTGIGNGTTVVLYGDNNNWFAAWAFWQMKIYGHKDVRIMNGGRKKWLAEGRDMETGPAKPKHQARDSLPALLEPDLILCAHLPVPRCRRSQDSKSADDD